MIEQITVFLKELLSMKALTKEWITVLVAAAPIFELRGSMPLAVALGLSLKKALALSIFGNFLPIIPVLFIFEPVSIKLRHFRLWARFFDWFFERTKKRAGLVEKFEAFGLMLFVALPLPGTGAWTGCIVASIFKIRFRYAFLAISGGVLIAALIVYALILLGKVLI